MNKIDPQELFKFMDKKWRFLACDAAGGKCVYSIEPLHSQGTYWHGKGDFLGIDAINIDIEPGQCIEREPEPVRFGDLEPGDKFRTRSSDYKWMKIHPLSGVNAVSYLFGTTYLQDECMVTPAEDEE